MNWVPLKSRMLAAVAYSDECQQLYLRFRSGDIYCYRGVPVERYGELLAADSVRTDRTNSGDDYATHELDFAFNLPASIG